MSCFESQELIERLLEGEPSGEVLLHAAECPACGQLLGELQLLTQALHGFTSAEPPPEVLHRALSLVEQTGWPGRVIDKLRAALVLDSSELVPVPVRGHVDGETPERSAGRFLRFESSPWVAELHAVAQEPGRHDLAGRLLSSEAEAPFGVLARGSSGQSFTRMSNAMGHFHFPSLPSDLYEISLELDAADVLLGPVELR